MDIEIKKSVKPVNYKSAINTLEKRVHNLAINNGKELIWFLEHKSIFTAGTSYKENEIIEKSIKIFKTNRGGKITWHGPGQIICYMVINLNKRKKDIRKFINIIENSIIKTLRDYKINAHADRKNIGIWLRVWADLIRGAIKIGLGFGESSRPYFLANQASGNIIRWWMNTAPDARQTALVGSVVVFCPCEGHVDRWTVLEH